MAINSSPHRSRVERWCRAGQYICDGQTAVVEHHLRLIVCEASGRVDDTLAETHVNDLAIDVHLPEDGEGQMIFVATQ